MLGNLKREIDQIAKDKGIDSDEITGALEEAMRQAARKRFGQDKEIEAKYNDEIGEVELFEFREVVETITDRDSQILIAEAQRDYDPDVEVGDEIGVKLDELYQPYWIEGAMQVKPSTSELADAGYQMEAEKIYMYELPE